MFCVEAGEEAAPQEGFWTIGGDRCQPTHVESGGLNLHPVLSESWYLTLRCLPCRFALVESSDPNWSCRSGNSVSHLTWKSPSTDRCASDATLAQ